MKNRIVFNYSESIMHFIAKCLVSRLLYRNRNAFLTEAPVLVGNRVKYVDVLDCNNGIAYELQTEVHRSIMAHKNVLYRADMIKDVILINLKEISPDVFTASKQLEKLMV